MDTRSGYAGEVSLLAFVTDDETENALKRIPYKEMGISHNIQRGGSSAAYNFLKKNDTPTLLIVDLSGSSLPITEIERISEVCEPSVKVLALGDTNDISVFRQLLNLGVSDYLVKPLNANLLVKRIREVLKKGAEQTESSGFSYSGHIISFVGAAGGVGCSTMAMNCGVALADRHNKHVGIIDLNMTAGTIGHMMDVPVTKGLVDILKDPKRVDPVLLDKVISEVGNRLDILSSEENVLDASSHCAPGMKVLMELMAQRYNYTIIDSSYGTSASLKELVFKHSNTTVIVCDLTFSSVRETSRLLRYFKDHATIEQKVMVMANKTNLYAEGQIPATEFEEAIDHPLTHCVGFDKVNPLEALNQGIPVLNTEGPLSKDISDFTGYLMGKPLVKKNKSFFKGMFSKASL